MFKNDELRIVEAVGAAPQRDERGAPQRVRRRLASEASTSWNKIIRDHGIDFELKLPHRGFNRGIGTFQEFHFSPDGKLLTEADWMHQRAGWVPSDEDYEYVMSLMRPVTEPGKFANWIAAPKRGINNQPVEFEYVRFN